jgi:tRNA A-37 threonylcarbamoyl transferase component Bud32
VRTLAGTNQNKPQPPPVRFENLNLLVKFGPHVTVSEAQSLWAIKTVLGDEIPVPELHGWRVDGRDVFIYMEYIQGETLKDRWDSLTDADKTSVCNHLRQIITSTAG